METILLQTLSDDVFKELIRLFLLIELTTTVIVIII